MQLAGEGGGGCGGWQWRRVTSIDARALSLVHLRFTLCAYVRDNNVTYMSYD